ncbi:hypothetical protein [Niallia sp. RD1]|uniref:hypothetical protein n=1 Tax=Niallia sp. RD1 TaxID=2962858 RepID=UPI0020C1AA55|nr:hypothetical protein [Niallia sp. RD1]UTI41137.1 hypothetical protein NKG37_20085 [Niallia sp. RD1]
MIKVKGSLTLRGSYEVALDMTEEEFDALSEREQNDEINDAMDWREFLDNSDIDDIDVDDIK